MRITALIPAKKKSVRLKNKNFILYKGIPIIEHTIKEAKKQNFFLKSLFQLIIKKYKID